jgi:Transcriptional regulator
MNSKQIETVLELAETLNFSRAAENLYLSQPTITYQLNELEKEIGFRIFDRSGKGAVLTPAGSQFIVTLRSVRQELKQAIEQGQNFSSVYQENVRICMPIRSALYYLPQTIEKYARENPSVLITPSFDWYHGFDSFLKGDQDILFAIENEVSHLHDVNIHPLYLSHIYLVCNKTDKLANKKIITEDDLKGRTLMVGGGSQAPLRAVQQRVLRNTGIDYFNSKDHDTSLTNVAAHKAVVLSPGFLNDHSNQFSWIPFDCPETISCVLVTHNNDQRWNLNHLIEILKNYYDKSDLNF